jgi:exosome complex protein LRP1
MDISDIKPLLEALEDNIDDLEEALEPLLKAPLSETASKLPLLDRANLYALLAYAIESVLFCEHMSSMQSVCVLFS